MKDTTPKCFQCGAPLIQVSAVTNHPEGSLFPQTSSVYRCSNEECQSARDKETAKRIKLKQERDDADVRRTEERKKSHDEKVKKLLEEHETSGESPQS